MQNGKEDPDILLLRLHRMVQRGARLDKIVELLQELSADVDEQFLVLTKLMRRMKEGERP